jgi:hypothetical protein
MELTAVTRLDTYARTSGSTTSLLPSANSMVRGVLESSTKVVDISFSGT